MTHKEAARKLHAMAESMVLRASELERLSDDVAPNDIVQKLDEMHDEFMCLITELDGSAVDV